MEDTICAPATPPVPSPIAIIRISGPETFRAVRSLFNTSRDIQPRQAHYGTISVEGKQIDDVVMVCYRSPRSYTGEDMAEIFCHGNPLIVRKIITTLNDRCVRMAEPGEFTRRAFLNGKIDLTEAEAINHIITARSEWEIETSIGQMHGSLKRIIRELRDRIIELKADIEAGIDFSEEDIEIISRGAALDRVTSIRDALSQLLGRCMQGEQLKHGIDITITGRPNVGKSSILNLILNQERAIVSNIPGTTRDIIRESIQINGIHVNLIDTAGIGTPGDEIERMGMDLSHKKIESSSLVLVVLDATEPLNAADTDILEKTDHKKRIILINKSDIARSEDIAALRKSLSGHSIAFSAKTGLGLSDMKDSIAARIKNEFVQIENSFVADIRIISLLEKALDNTHAVKNLIEKGEPGEITAFELQCLLDNLSAITGEITSDDVLNSIFDRFCIGK